MVLLYIKDIFILVAAAVALTRLILRWSASVAFIIALGSGVVDSASITVTSSNVVVSSEIAMAGAVGPAAATSVTVVTTAEAVAMTEAIAAADISKSAAKAMAQRTMNYLFKVGPLAYTLGNVARMMWYQSRVATTMAKYALAGAVPPVAVMQEQMRRSGQISARMTTPFNLHTYHY